MVLYTATDNPLAERRPDIGINIIFIFFSIWLYKSRNGGYLHFYEAFSIGFLANIIGAFITGLSIYSFVKFIDPSPFENWITQGKAYIVSQKEALSVFLNEESFKLQLEAFDNAQPYQIILDDLMFKQLAIIAVTLISMALIKRRPEAS